MSTLATRSWIFIPFHSKKELSLLGETADSRPGAGNNNMNQEHLIKPEKRSASK
jgi:hypothetical protein